MSDMKELLLNNDYVISNKKYDDEKVIVLKNSEEFLKWFLGDKSLHDKKIGFILDEDGTVKKMEVMYEFLKYYNLDITIVATKYDKISKNNRIKQDKLIKDTLKFSEDDNFVTFSTITKKGRAEILDILDCIIENYKK